MVATDGETILFDLQTNKSEAKPFKSNGHRSDPPLRSATLEDIIALANPDKNVPLHLRGGDVIYGDWLWGLLIPLAASRSMAPRNSASPARQKHNRYFNPNECFQILDNGTRLLLADQHGIWLARLPQPK